MTVDDIITGIIQREGPVYTNRAADKGGPTKFGITQETLSKVRGHAVSALDVQNLGEPEARAIYRKTYVEDPGFARLTHQQLQVQCIDWGVTSGADDPSKALQKLLGLAQDGHCGPVTAQAANAFPDQHKLSDDLMKLRVVFYCRIVQHDIGQISNLVGWVNRALGFDE